MRFDNLKDWLAWQEGLNPKEIELGLERSARVLKQLGHSSSFDCPLITVAGTNGKGSIVAMLEAIAVSVGLKVCSYTSPHIFEYSERIKIDRQAVADTLICEAFQRIDNARGDDQLTYFEFGTLAAIDLFFRAEVDLVILEVGLGGRLDAVNIMDPDVSILSSVAIDHVDWLGDDREKIGYEKAGIFRPGRTVVCADAQPPLSVIKRAQELNCNFLQREKDYSVVEESGAGWCLKSPYVEISSLPAPSLIGAFQKDNAATAVVAMQVLQHERLLDSLPAAQQTFVQILTSALTDIRLSGRFQKVHEAPDVFVDVAHNPHAALGLKSQLQISAKNGPVKGKAGEGKTGKGKTWAVVAMLADKDINQVIRNVASEVDFWCFAGLDGEMLGISRGLPVSELLPNVPPKILPDVTVDAVLLSDRPHEKLMADLAREMQSNPCKMLGDTVILAHCGTGLCTGTVHGR